MRALDAVEAWDSPVLSSTIPVIEASRNVRTSDEGVRRVAGWMAYEEFGLPDGSFQFDFGHDPDVLTDLVMFESALNFAFTDFSTSVKFEVDYQGRRYTDSEAMLACVHRAFAAGQPILDGAWMASVDRPGLARLFAGTIEMPMLDERVAILNEIGSTLVDRFEGRFHVWANGCRRALWADGEGLLERLLADFPRFEDSSLYDGQRVQFYKLAQLSLWSLHAVYVRLGGEGLRDLRRSTAFADYIVPVALRLIGITEYTPDLEARINGGVLIPRDSPDEVELRAHTIYATALLTSAINELRPADMQLVIPQVDYRLWKTYHATFWPHHLTRTTMY
jgi:Potential Queuosine, Q, salvage protein family